MQTHRIVLGEKVKLKFCSRTEFNICKHLNEHIEIEKAFLSLPNKFTKEANVSLIVLTDTRAELHAAWLVSSYSTANCQVQLSYFPFLL